MIQHSDFLASSCLHSKSSLTLKLTSFSYFSIHTAPSNSPSSQRTRLNIYSCTVSFLHTLHLSANPFFITSWSNGVFFHILFSILSWGFIVHLFLLFVVGFSRVVVRLYLFSLSSVSLCLPGCLFLHLYIN